LNQSILANDLKYLEEINLQEIRKLISKITYKLNGLIKNLDYKSEIK